MSAALVSSPGRARLLAALTLGAGLLAGLRPAHAKDPGAPLVVDLYTIGAGNYVYAAHGHSALCVTGGAHPEGRCYDYGIPSVEGDLNMVWKSLRGDPIFVVVAVDQKVLVSAFGAQERTIEKQRLPLSAGEAQALAAALERDVTTRASYAYHPSTANCTTKIRDVMDEAMGGKLHAVTPAREVPRFREILENGFRGQPLTLAAIALFSGTTIERPPSPWEHLFLPSRLRDAVEERFGAKPETVYGRSGATVPLSTWPGRGLLVVLGAALAALVFRARGDAAKLRRETRFVGFLLGLLGLLLASFALLFVYPELSHNWALGVLWPTDLALRWMEGVWLRRYLVVRLGAALSLGTLSALGLVAQPIVSVATLVALPFLALLLAHRRLGATAAVPPATGPLPISTDAGQ